MPSDFRPTLLLDIDDVIVLNRGVEFDKTRVDELSTEACQSLIHPPAGQALSQLVEEFHPRIVVTSAWVRFTSQPAMARLLRLAGYEQVAQSLHDIWSAPRQGRSTRLESIDHWLGANHIGEPFCILDDGDSGSSLRGSSHDQARRVLLCEVGVGLHVGHLPFVRNALLESPPQPLSASKAEVASVRRASKRKV